MVKKEQNELFVENNLGMGTLPRVNGPALYTSIFKSIYRLILAVEDEMWHTFYLPQFVLHENR